MTFPCAAIVVIEAGVSQTQHPVTLLRERGRSFLARWTGPPAIQRSRLGTRVIRRFRTGAEYWVRKGSVVLGDPRAGGSSDAE